MKTCWQRMTGSLILAAIVLTLTSKSAAQNNRLRPAEYGIVPMFSNNPAAMFVITNLMNEPQPELAVPAVSQNASGASGTYWTLKGAAVPLPFDPYPDLPVYQVSTNRQFIIDDRSVDYVTLNALAALEAEVADATNSVPFTGCQTCAWDEGGLLWIEVPTNSLADPGQFNAVLHNTVQGQNYDVLTTSDLLLPWAAELVVTGAVGNLTPVQIPMNNHAYKFLRARTSVTYSFYLVTLPLSQTAQVNDMVTFYVETGGNTNLTFQWTFNGSAIDGATNSSYTINRVQSTDGGDYACIISDGTNSLVTAAGTLSITFHGGGLNRMKIYSARQNYTFKSGVTYYVPNQFQFYGKTTIEAGAVIKPDWMYGAGLVIVGTLDCQGEPYLPAVITSVDDDSIGANLGFSDWDGWPQPYQTGVPYLELACCKSNSIHNLRIAYADYGVTTPTASQRLDLWDCQFLQCNYGVVNLVPGSSTNTLHNVLFATCGAAIGADTNAITIEAEQVTADVTNFCLAAVTPDRMALTNSIILGTPPVASSMVSVHVALNPDGTNFASSGTGITSTSTAMYYLAANSPLHQSGSANISPRLQAELRNKTTYAPVALPPWMNLSGNMTLLPQAPRYTNGAPDIGYYYAALDYTMADLRLTGGTLNVLPGTAVGFRMDFVWAATNWTYIGMDVCENSHLNVQGMPNKPCVFVDVQQVQEQFAWPVRGNFVPDYWPQYDSDQPPVLNFRFANLYADYVSYYQTPQYHFWSGISYYGQEWSADSAMFFTLQDCQLRGGQLDIGTPDNPDSGYGFLNYDTVLGNGAVTWNNNLFDGVSINLNPTYFWMNTTNNCDMQVIARNNLFRNALWFNIYGTPASAGNWTFQDNLFDKVQFYQDPTLPLDFDHNGYWPLAGEELIWSASGFTSNLQATATSDASTEVFLSNAPPYQSGAFGKYYLSHTTPLYRAGSRTAADAGLTQYTTYTNQAKDSASQPVNIGLHYVAATNALPLDSDGDGVPDYVEVEHSTDPNNPMTDGVTPDTLNAAYDDVDLSGSGLVGRIKKALGLNPTNSVNPLTMKQVITGEEPDIATFEVPVNYDAVASSGTLNINMNGIDVTLEECNRATNGNCLLSFNVDFDPKGQHLLSAGFRLASEPAAELHPVMTANGNPNSFVSSNVVQFFEANTMFDDTSAYLDAKLFVASADYTIDLYDASTTPNTWIMSITNSTSDGVIQEEWGITNADGSPFTGNDIEAYYNVFPQGTFAANSLRVKPMDAGGGKSPQGPSRTLTRATNSLSEWGPNMDVAYFYTPTNSSLNTEFAKDGAIWNGIQGVVDALTMPAFGYDVYNSYFNHYTCYFCGPGEQPYPGYITSRSTVTNNLLSDLANGLTKQFYAYGHGNSNYIGNYTSDAYISSYDVRDKLHNTFAKKGGLKAQNPYRFVFLDGCSTASAKDWRRAFGVYPLDVTNNVIRSKVGPQAYVGWADVHVGWFNGVDDSVGAVNIAKGYAQTLANFYSEWMHGFALVNCIYDGTKSTYGCVPFPVPENKQMLVSGNGYRYQYTNVMTGKIYLIGFPGLKVNATDRSLDGNTTYAAPKNVE